MKSTRMRWAGHVAPMGETNGTFRGLMGKPEGKRPLGRPRRRWENNIKIDLRDVPWSGLFWLRLVTGSRFFLIWLWIFGLHTMREISWLAENLLASQEKLCSIQLFLLGDITSHKTVTQYYQSSRDSKRHMCCLMHVSDNISVNLQFCTLS